MRKRAAEFVQLVVVFTSAYWMRLPWPPSPLSERALNITAVMTPYRICYHWEVKVNSAKLIEGRAQFSCEGQIHSSTRMWDRSGGSMRKDRWKVPCLRR